MWLDILLSPRLFVLVLPSNLNYLKNYKTVKRYFSTVADNFLTVVDVGSRGAPPPELMKLKAFAQYIGFDADPDAALPNRREQLLWNKYQIIEAFVGGAEGPVEFHNYKDGGLSSTYKISEHFNEIHGTTSPLISTVELDQVSLHGALGNKLLSVDFLKLDTQGSELQILTSKNVDQIPLIEVEVEFREVYEGQPLFHQVDSFMNSRGYQILYLSRAFGSPEGTVLGRGMLVAGDVLYGFGPKRALELPPEKLERYLLLLSAYGHTDFADYLFRQQKSKQTLSPSIEEVIHALAPIRGGSWARRRFLGFLRAITEKVAILMLALSRHNGMKSDSDRALPFR
jgi:FkbM family methyltransferase